MITVLPLDTTSMTIGLNYNRKAATLGHVKAYTKCGDFIYSGKAHGGRRDKSEAFKCYQRAAQGNDPEAMNNLGLMLETGFDDKLSNGDQALEYYLKAHKLDFSDATVNIGLYYLNVLSLILIYVRATMCRQI